MSAAVDRPDWDRLRRMVYRRAAFRCEVCGATRDPATKVWLAAHERWDYDGERRVQTLTRLICLCTTCHEATHYGLATLRGREAVARRQLMAVNRWTQAETDQHVRSAFQMWELRSESEWSLDLHILTSAGVRLRQPPGASDRRRVAEAAVQNTHPQESQYDSTSQNGHATAALPPPAWYPDPAGHAHYRWWDCAAWTGHVHRRPRYSALRS
jgi:hypothetical protein